MPTPSLNDRITAATGKAENASQIMHDVANGGAAVEVLTESGLVPSIAKWFADLNDSTDGAVGQVAADLAAEVLARQQADNALAGAINNMQWLPTSENVTTVAGRRYALLASVTASLPAAPALGDTVEFAKLVGATPLIQTTDGTQLLVKGQADTAVTYNFDARLLAVFNGTAWEI